MKKRGQLSRAVFLGMAMGLALVGCGGFGGSTANVPTDLWAVDTKSGQVFEIDSTTSPATGAMSPYVTIGQNAAGEIVFGQGKGFVAVGSYSNTAPGLYWFDPESAYPVASRIGAGVSAQYACLVSATKGYVTVANYSPTTDNGLYSFNPTSPAAGLTKVLGNGDLTYPQDLTLGEDGYLYVADNEATITTSFASGKVLKLDTTSDTVAATYTTSVGGCTGVLAGVFDGDEGIFVASTGGYDGSYYQVAGTVEFIASGLATGSAAAMVASGIPVARLSSFDSSHLISTGGYPAATKLIALSGSSSIVTSVQIGGVDFGSADVDVVDGVAYIPGGFSSNTVYAVTGTGTVSTFTVGSSAATVGITNVGAYRP